MSQKEPLPCLCCADCKWSEQLLWAHGSLSGSMKVFPRCLFNPFQCDRPPLDFLGSLYLFLLSVHSLAGQETAEGLLHTMLIRLDLQVPCDGTVGIC